MHGLDSVSVGLSLQKILHPPPGGSTTEWEVGRCHYFSQVLTRSAASPVLFDVGVIRCNNVADICMRLFFVVPVGLVCLTQPYGEVVDARASTKGV